MEEKWKNLSIALIIAVIVTGIFAIASYIIVCETILKEMNELEEEYESKDALGPTLGVSDNNEQVFQEILFGIFVFSVFIFCMATLVSYLIIKKLRKKKQQIDIINKK